MVNTPAHRVGTLGHVGLALHLALGADETIPLELLNGLEDDVTDVIVADVDEVLVDDVLHADGAGSEAGEGGVLV